LPENPNSKLSAYLRWGQLSPQDIYWEVKKTGLSEEVVQTFERRLFWRDLAYFQLNAFPEMREKPIRTHYAKMAWSQDGQMLSKWQQGQTGYPLVDATMRELWSTGWSQQNMRMLAASFLTEFCNIDWVQGARWYEDNLVDADIAVNSMMWQNAGRSGIDQLNFVISPDNGQSQDPSGDYVRRWVPELKDLPDKFLHRPWEAPPEVLSAAGLQLGSNYPERCIENLSEARAACTAATLEMRRMVADTQWNDKDGYDIIVLPDGHVSKVFTRKDLRLTRDGKPAPATRSISADSDRGGSRRWGNAGRRGQKDQAGGTTKLPRHALPENTSQPGCSAKEQLWTMLKQGGSANAIDLDSDSEV